MLCLCSLLGIWWYCVLYLSLWANFSLFLCMIWRSSLTSLTCMWLSSFPKITCWINSLFPIVYFCLLCGRLTDHRCVSFFLGSLFCSIGPNAFCSNTKHCFNYCSFVYCLKSRKIRPSALFFFFKIPFANSESFMVPYIFYGYLFLFWEKWHG